MLYPALLMLANCYAHLEDEEAYEQCVKKAIRLSAAPDQVFGGLAFIQQQSGDWARAARNYEAALTHFAARVAGQMSETNAPDTAVKCWPGRRGIAWLQYAESAWSDAISDAGLAGFVLPTRVMFADQEFGQRVRGLYWRGVRQQDGTLLRQYLPNGVHSFLYRCYDLKDYRIMVLGRAIALMELGRSQEAEPYLFEAALLQHLEITSDSALSATDPGLRGFACALLSGISEHASAIHISVEDDGWQVCQEIEGTLRSLPDVAELLPTEKEAGLLTVERIKEHSHMTTSPNGDQVGQLTVMCAGHLVSFDVVVTQSANGLLARLTTRNASQHRDDEDDEHRGLTPPEGA